MLHVNRHRRPAQLSRNFRQLDPFNSADSLQTSHSARQSRKRTSQLIFALLPVPTFLLLLMCVDSAVHILVHAVHDHDRYSISSSPQTKVVFSHRFALPTTVATVRRVPAVVPTSYFNYYDDLVPDPFASEPLNNMPPDKNPNKTNVAKTRRQKVSLPNRAKADSRFPIHILGLFELSAPDLAANARADLVAAQIAVEHVNERNYLPGYRLQLHVNDSKCRVGRGVNSFFHEIKEMQHKPFSSVLNHKTKLTTTKISTNASLATARTTQRSETPAEQLMFVLGPGPCDELAYVLAQITSFWNVIQVSFGATSPLLSACAHECHTFFRTVAPDNSHNSARRGFIKHHNWQRIAVLSESKKIYSLSADAIKRDLENLDRVELVVTKSFDKSKLADADDPIMSELKEKDARIIIGSFSLDLARRLMCKAFKNGLYGPKFVWMLPGWFPPKWWLDASSVPCTSEQMAKAVDGYISVTSSDALQSNYTPPDINISVDEFLDQFRTRMRNTITVDIDDTAPDGAYLIQRQQLTAIPPTVGEMFSFNYTPTSNIEWGAWAASTRPPYTLAPNASFSTVSPRTATARRRLVLANNAPPVTVEHLASTATTTPNPPHLAEESLSSASAMESSKTISGALQVYDSVWVIAKALKQALDTIDPDLPRRFTYDNDDITRQLVGIIQQLDFKGMSGQVTFQGADRRGKSLIQQLQSGALVPIATYDPEVFRLRFNCSQCLPLSWVVTGNVPVDRTIIKHVTLYVSFEAFIIISIVAVAGALLAGSFLVFNLRYRNTRSRSTIKLSSPNLNNVTTIGCMLIFISIILMGLDRNVIDDDGVLLAACHLRAIFVCFGFTLAFGSLFAKTFRVYQIFRKASSGVVKSKLLRDTQLLLAVFFLTCLDSVILIIWMSTDPLRLYRRSFEEFPERAVAENGGAASSGAGVFFGSVAEDVIILYDVEQCNSQYSTTIWLYIFYAYKGLLLVAGVFLTWQTRHVKIAALNDSQAVGFSIYNVVTSTTLVVALSYILSNNVNALFIATSLLSMATTMATLCFLFVPKIVKLSKPSEPDPLLSGTGLREVSKTKRLDVDDPRENLLREEIRHRVFKHDLQRLKQQIERIELLLSCPLTAYDNVTEEVLFQQLPESSVDMSPDTVRKRRLLHAMDSRTTATTDKTTSGIDAHGGGSGRHSSSLMFHHNLRHAPRTSPLSYTSSGRTITTTTTAEDNSTTASVRTVDSTNEQALLSPCKTITHHLPLLRSSSGQQKPGQAQPPYSEANIVKISLAAYSQLSQPPIPAAAVNNHAPLAERPSRLRIRSSAAAHHRKSSHQENQHHSTDEKVSSPADEETILITTSDGMLRLLVQKDDEDDESSNNDGHSPTFHQQSKRRLSLHQRVIQKLSPAFGLSPSGNNDGDAGIAAAAAQASRFGAETSFKPPNLERLQSAEAINSSTSTSTVKKGLLSRAARHSLTDALSGVLSPKTAPYNNNTDSRGGSRLVKKRSSIFLPFITFGSGGGKDKKSSPVASTSELSSNSSNAASAPVGSSTGGGGIRKFLYPPTSSSSNKSTADHLTRRRVSLSTAITADEADERATCIKLPSASSVAARALLQPTSKDALMDDEGEQQRQSRPSHKTQQRQRKESLNRIVEDEVDSGQQNEATARSNGSQKKRADITEAARVQLRESEACMHNAVYPGYEV